MTWRVDMEAKGMEHAKGALQGWGTVGNEGFEQLLFILLNGTFKQQTAALQQSLYQGHPGRMDLQDEPLAHMGLSYIL